MEPKTKAGRQVLLATQAALNPQPSNERMTILKKNSTRQLTKRETAELKRWGDEFGRGLHEFASQAYFDAVHHYSKHYNDPLPRDADFEKSAAGLAGLILAILNHPKTPVALYNAVAAWTSDAIQIKDSSGETLLDRWRLDPATITASVSWGNERDDLKAMTEENMVTIARG